MASAVLVAKWPHAVPEHGKNLRNYSLKFTGKLVSDPLILQDNARYEGTLEKLFPWVLKRAPE